VSFPVFSNNITDEREAVTVTTGHFDKPHKGRKGLRGVKREQWKKRCEIEIANPEMFELKSA